jgi:hypothetical protein
MQSGAITGMLKSSGGNFINLLAVLAEFTKKIRLIQGMFLLVVLLEKFCSLPRFKRLDSILFQRVFFVD